MDRGLFVFGGIRTRRNSDGVQLGTNGAPAAAGAPTKEWNGAVESEENGTVESESAAIAEEKSLAGSARAAAGKKSFADLAVSAGGAAAESESISWGIWGL